MNSWDHSLSFKRILKIVPLVPNESNSERNDLQRREYRVREVHRMRTAFHDIDCRRAGLWSQARVGLGRCVW
jgi:type II secretory pathway component PulJ